MLTQLTHVDLGALVAPRPLLVESGTGDPIFPVDGARRAMVDLRLVYEVLGAPFHVEHDVFEGDHRWNGVQAMPFLANHLESYR
jgi:hypothetical protein